MATSADVEPMQNGEGTVDVDLQQQEEVKPAMEYIYISENKLKYINNKYEKVNARMYDYKCDVKLIVGKSSFKGHRKVLADASDYFAAMFTHAMKEKDETVIELKEISPDGFSAMLDYFYHGHVTIEEKTVPDVLEAARFFHVDWIYDICCDFLIRHLSLLDYPLAMHLADKFALGDLRWEIFKYFGQNLPTLVEKDSFFKDTSVELLMQFLMEGLYVEVSELFFLQLILNWVHFDLKSRKEHFLPLLRQLRFPTMELEELEQLPEEIFEFPEIKDEVEEAKNYCLNIASQCLKTDDKYLCRGTRLAVVLSTFSDETESNIVAYKDACNDESSVFIEHLGPCGLSCDYSTMNQTNLGNFLFAAGGYDAECTSSGVVFRFDPRFREWTQVATMSHPRVSFAMCSSKNRIYVVGGVYHTAGDIETGDTILPSVERYNPEENTWTTLASLPYGVFDLASAYAENKLYASGGISDLPTLPLPLGTMQCLSDGADQWTELPNMLNARQGHSMTTVGNKLYVLGGYSGNSTEVGFKDCVQNEVFDIETKQWTAIVSTPENFGHLFRHVGLVDTRIFFLCNKDSDVFLSHFDTNDEKFDEGVVVGPGLDKVSALNVAYPQTT